ncbi:MAG TPA: hypothetical protein VML19_30635 [Verrucomicrobiae bacterium]|nr:hypothetical protein [Verrucomicrobiae bacterium]
MLEEKTTCTYRIDEPFSRALKQLRKALAAANVKISGEIDMADRVRGSLLLSVPPCVVLLAWMAAWPAEDLPLDPCAAALTPLHIVVSARGPRTEVHFLRALPGSNRPPIFPCRYAAGRLQAEIARVLGKIGRRSLDD